MKYCEVAKARGVSQMGITEHDRYLELIDLAAFQEARELSHDVELRLGIEIDSVPGAEERMDNDATALPYDYIIGSVHGVDSEEVDRATDQRIYDRYETYDLYAAYYANVRKAALSGRFEILGHPDLHERYSATSLTGTSRRSWRRPLTPSPSPASSSMSTPPDSGSHGRGLSRQEISRNVSQERRPDRPLLGCPRPGSGRNGLRYEPRARRDVGYREVATFRNHERGTLPL